MRDPNHVRRQARRCRMPYFVEDYYLSRRVGALPITQERGRQIDRRHCCRRCRTTQDTTARKERRNTTYACLPCT